MEKALFAAGCFWGVQREFDLLDGVESTLVGYTGGSPSKPTYEEVCKGNTGHAESVLVYYDPEKISYTRLLDKFWQIHDPTSLNKQGPDVGSQYRSAIFFFTEEQKKEALRSKQAMNETTDRPVITEVIPAGEFYRAEDYHQKYYKKQI